MKKKRSFIRLIAFLCFWLVSLGQVFAQDIQVSGKVSDATNDEPLPGVSVMVKGTTIGVVTDVDGQYQISIPQNSVLVFSFVGYNNLEKVVDASKTLDVKLEPAVSSLDEIVVIGYGTVKKSDATGSVSVIGSKDLNKGVVTSPQDLITGKIAGVVVTTGDGAPGSGATIRIRGGSSLSASNDPLIIIDGVPVDNSGVSGLSNPLSTINPNDIESFSVLKDASATAIYGSRASNGVILITTKKGKAGTLHVTYNGTASFQVLPEVLDVYSGDEYRSALLKQVNAGTFSDDALGLLGSYNTNWQKEIYQVGFGHDHNLSFSGTAKMLPYRVSLGLSDQEGVLKTSEMTRYTGAVNLSPSLLDNHLKINLNVKGSYNKSRFANTGAIGNAISFDPTQPVKNGNTFQDGYYAWMSGASLMNDQSNDNPVAQLMMTNNKGEVYRGIGNLQIDYSLPFLPELRANLNLGGDYSTTDGHNFTPTNTSWTTSFLGNKEKYTQDRKMELLEFYLNYTKDIASIASKVDVTGGYSWQHFWWSNTDLATTADEATVNANTSSKYQNYLISFFGRLNYTLLDRYLLTATVRRDGSSHFSSDNRWGTFPSFAFAWKIKNESFLKDVNAISDLKLRLGYGETGQQDVGSEYPYLPVYVASTADSTAQYQIGNTFSNTLRPSGYDKNIKWESTKTYNVALDFGFANDRLTGSIDYYLRKTSDLLNEISVPAGSNLKNQIYTNIGNMENKGIELSLNARIISNPDMYWEIAYNIAYNENKITKLTMVDDASTYKTTGSISGGVGNTIQAYRIGSPINAFNVYQQVYDEAGNPIEGLYVDQNNDEQINESDLREYKKPAADVLMGISSRFGYKGFDFSFSGRISLGNYVYNNINSSNALYVNMYNSGNQYTANIVKAVEKTKFVNSQYFSDYYVENASFFKMDNMSLGYSFKNLFQKDVTLRISGVVQNVFTITKYSGLDPEVYSGIDNNLYPRPRTYMLGLELGF